MALIFLWTLRVAVRFVGVAVSFAVVAIVLNWNGVREEGILIVGPMICAPIAYCILAGRWVNATSVFLGLGFGRFVSEMTVFYADHHINPSPLTFIVLPTATLIGVRFFDRYLAQPFPRSPSIFRNDDSLWRRQEAEGSPET